MEWWDDPWEKRFRLAEAYFRAHGELNVPMKYVVDGIRLGQWLYFLRKQKNTLSPEQITRLDHIGMQWNIQTR